MHFSSSLLMENWWIGVVPLLIYTRWKWGLEIEPIPQHAKLITDRVRKPLFSLTCSRAWAHEKCNTVFFAEIPILGMQQLNIVLDPRLGIRLNSAEPQLKVPETEQQKMLESKETKVSKCESSTNQRLMVQIQGTGLFVGLCGGGEETLV